MAKNYWGKNQSDLFLEFCSILAPRHEKNVQTKCSNNWYLLCQDNLNEIMYPSYVQGRSLETAGRSTLDNQYSQKVHENFIQNKFNETGYTCISNFMYSV